MPKAHQEIAALRPAALAAIFRNELRMVLRDRRIIFTSILLPLLVMPILLLGSSWTSKKRAQALRDAEYRYAVAGSQSDRVRAVLSKSRDQAAARGKNSAPFQFSEVAVTNAERALDRGEIQFFIEALSADENSSQLRDGNSAEKPLSRRKAGLSGASSDDEEDGVETGRPPAGTPVWRIVFRADRDDSTAGMDRMMGVFREARSRDRAGLLKDNGFQVEPQAVASALFVNLASPGKVAGLMFGRVLSLLLLLFVFTGGAVIAIDLLAGEKERGTLETLLATGASRAEIIVAKHLIVLAAALAITFIQSANLLVYAGFKLIPSSAAFISGVSPMAAILLLILFLPMAALAASALLLVSGYAKTYKEAQLYFLPVFLIGLLPAAAPLLPGLPLRSAIVIAPIAGVAVAARDILSGSFDWPMIVTAWLSTSAAAAGLTWASIRFLSAERLMTAAPFGIEEFAGGPALFERRLAPWFATLWASVLMVDNYIASADIRAQLLVNLVGFFLGASLLMIWRYRLPVRAALALRAPKPFVWLGVLFAIPGGLLTGIGLFRVAAFFIPVPAEMMEGFSESILPRDISGFQLFLFLAVLPGFFEEIVFRGLLLYGLHRRWRPVAVALLVGLVFGLFHVALFRLAPTAFLGILLSAVTLLTGSIFPAILWHIGNNGTSILAAKYEVPLSELDFSNYLAGVIMLAAAFWIFWRNRTVYPGLRPWRTKKFKTKEPDAEASVTTISR